MSMYLWVRVTLRLVPYLVSFKELLRVNKKPYWDWGGGPIATTPFVT